jgi:hypothetical protein
MCTSPHGTKPRSPETSATTELLKTGQSCLPLYPHRFILAPKAMQKIKGSETKKHTNAHNTTSLLYVQFMRAQQETHNKTCRRKQKMREIHGQVHLLIACHTTRHQGRVWCIQGLLYRTAVRRHQDTASSVKQRFSQKHDRIIVPRTMNIC